MANNPTSDTARRETSQVTHTRGERPSSQGSLARRSSFGLSPFSSIFQRWNDEMDRFFEDFGVGGMPFARDVESTIWSPRIDVFQRGNDLVVRADLPGLTKDDVHAEINDAVLTIRGERKHEQERQDEREGWYRSERTYGSFFRSVPLPEGTIADSAKATFKNGVLEIKLQAPPKEVRQGRRLEIKET